MADVVDQRIILQQEEVKYRASNSESTLSRMAAVSNFHAKRQYDTKGFFVNGPYSILGAPQLAVDGAFMALFNMRIVGVMVFNITPGTTGVTTFDIRRRTASNTPPSGTSIFSTKPAIASTAGNNAFNAVDYSTGSPVVIEPASGGGSATAVLSITDIDAGDLLTLNLDTVQSGAENAGLVLYYQPR